MKIGIDLGGTKTEAILIDHNGKELARKRIKTKETTDKAVQALIIGLALVLFLLVGCENGARHSLELTEPTDHTSGDDGGKLKYKIIWGSTKHND